jgi:hypothetical protein
MMVFTYLFKTYPNYVSDQKTTACPHYYSDFYLYFPGALTTYFRYIHVEE